MTSVGTKVICSQCGKTLRGVEGVRGGWHVRAHKNPKTGLSCWGARRTDHRKVS